MRCRRWSKRGKRYCAKHLRRHEPRGDNGRSVLGQLGNNHSRARRVERLPMAYSKTLSKALAEAVERHRDTGLDLSEELTLTRAAAEGAVQMYDAACLSCEEGLLTGEKADLAKTVTAVGMKNALMDVATMAQRAAQVAESRANMLSGVALSSVLAQVVEAAHRVLGETPEGVEQARQLAAEVRKIRAPSGAVQGTTLTPDADVAAMDATIPRE